MTPTAWLTWFIFMAVATTTILVVATLAAADLLHFRRRQARPDVSDPGGVPAQKPARPPVGVSKVEGHDGDPNHGAAA